jgi:alanine racemase
VPRTEAVIDLAAIRGNVATLCASTRAQVMAVVKADGYGHGLLPSARAALAGGATWLGVAIVDEAISLREAGIAAPILAWLWTPDERHTVLRAVAAGIDVSVSSRWQLHAVGAAAAGPPARIHLKIDTGLSRSGAHIREWPELVMAAAKAQADGSVEIVGVWSHFVYADEPGHPTTARQIADFRDALDVAQRAGLNPQICHLANSAATLTLPDAHFDLVRPGIAVYGLSPVPQRGSFGLTPAMSVRAQIAGVKRVPAGTGVSYGHAYATDRETTLALVPLGYADGIARAAGNVGPLSINGMRSTVSGRVCMDQFVVDVGQNAVSEGDTAVLFGAGADGEPLAQDWADAVATIHYEIVTRIGPRVARRYVNEQR